MPASQSGFGNFFLERNLSMATGYPGIPVLGVQQQQQQQQQQHLAAMAAAGIPVTYPGLQGYSFIPYPHHRPVAHMNTFDLKAASPYHHHALLARSAAFFPPYRSGSLEDPGRVAKVATRESTGALKAWLNEHLKNPYPTKGEKIMLAIITKMSLTQVSTWFANARRRLKKENRVSWASRSKSDEEDEEEEEEEEEEERADVESEDESARRGRGADDEQPRAHAAEQVEGVMDVKAVVDDRLEKVEEEKEEQEGEPRAENAVASRPLSKDDVHKPKIWSLAETATSQSVRRPSDGVPQQAGKLWAEWASRNGLLVAPCYTSHELL